MTGLLAASAVSGGKDMDKYKGISMLIIVVAVIALAFIVVNKVFGGINGILEGLGLKDSEEEIRLNSDLENFLRDTSNPTNPFSPAFYKNAPADSKLFKSAFADQLARQIYDSVGVFYDDPESALAAIKQCTTKSQVSFISDRFNVMFKKDLITWLDQKFDTNNQKRILREIYSYAASLPKYK